MSQLKTLADIENRKIELERSIKLKRFQTESTAKNTVSELPRFFLKKVALPATFIALAAIGISKLTKSSKTENSNLNYKAQEEEETSDSILTRAWLFAMPFIQGFLKDFVSNKFKEFRS